MDVSLLDTFVYLGVKCIFLLSFSVLVVVIRAYWDVEVYLSIPFFVCVIITVGSCRFDTMVYSWP